MKRTCIMLIPIWILGTVTAFGQLGLRDSIFRAQDSYQQGRLMGEGDASGMLGILGNIIPDEGGSINLPGVILSGAFGLLGSAKAAKERAKEKMEQEHYMMSQYLNPGMGGYPQMQGGMGYGGGMGSYPGAGSAYYGQPNGNAQPYPLAQSYLQQPQSYGVGYPQQPTPPIRRAIPLHPVSQPANRTVASAPPKPAVDPAKQAEKKAQAAAAAAMARERDLSGLNESLEGVFGSEFDVDAPATEETPTGTLEESLDSTFKLELPPGTPKM